MRLCKKFIEIEKKSNPRFYTLRGIDLPGHRKTITDRGMGVGSPVLDKFLEGGRALKIHDIAIKFTDTELHRLLKGKHPPDPANSCIHLDIFISEWFTNVKVLIYPKRIVIHIVNTYNPIIRDYWGVLHLYSVLCKVSHRLSILTGHFRLVRPDMWIGWQYHLGIDARRWNASKPSTEISIEEFGDTLLRFYTKHMPSGQVGRLEVVKSPQTTVAEEFDAALSSPDGSAPD